jgi:hypothetical protein
MESEESKFGKMAYEAYCETTNWKSAVTGANLPPFYQTPQAVQEGWIAAAQAVKAATLGQEHRLIQDNDGHWYVIQVGQVKEFWQYIDAMQDDEAEWNGFDFDKCSVGGDISTVKFKDYQIG